jgi:CelD/BcsL family acetyltransferase involved in cellulose biosynthesis
MAVANDRIGDASVRLSVVPDPAAYVLVHRAADAIADLAPEWAALAAAPSEPNPFAEPWFVAASLAHLAGDRPLRLLEVRRAGRLIGVMIVSVESRYGRTPVAFTQNWCHHQAFLGTPLVAPGEEQCFWSAVLAALDEADWAPGFLHLRGLVESGPVHRGLTAAAAAFGRAAPVVNREVRAFLESDLGPAAYYAQAVRQKKRKEIRRLSNRLAELGPVRTCGLETRAELDGWCDAFLALERAGWKGQAGSALASALHTEAFFRAAVAGAHDAGRLQFLRLDVDGRAIAMLVNFLTPPGSFSFKTVFAEDFARFSPGVLIQIENLAILDRPDIDWMDSCAAEDHPMIDSLWSERRTVVRVTVPLRGAKRTAIFHFCHALERGSAFTRRLLAKV